MWMLDPEKMCLTHIAGEHGEIHKHRHNFVKGHSISGRVRPVTQIEPMSMKRRHDQLAKYLKSHKSPYTMPDLSYLPDDERTARVDAEASHRELAIRCERCRIKTRTH